MGIARPAPLRRIGTICSLRIISAMRNKATKQVISDWIRAKKSQKRPKSATEAGSGEGTPGPRSNALALSSADLHTGIFYEDENGDGQREPGAAAEGAGAGAGRRY